MVVAAGLIINIMILGIQYSMSPGQTAHTDTISHTKMDTKTLFPHAWNFLQSLITFLLAICVLRLQDWARRLLVILCGITVFLLVIANPVNKLFAIGFGIWNLIIIIFLTRENVYKCFIKK